MQVNDEFQQLMQQLQKQTALVEELTKANLSLLEQNGHLVQTIDALNQRIDELTQRIAELTEQKNKNSKNSSKPPSSDGYNKPNPKSLRKPSGKKAGGQDGHEGKNLAMVRKPDDVIQHLPAPCEHCPHYQECKGKECIAERRQVVDAVVKVTVIEHQRIEMPGCPVCGHALIGEFPDTVKAATQYGINLQSLVVALNTLGAVSVNRTHEILSGVFGIPMATGTISNIVSRFSGSLASTMEDIRNRLIAAEVVNFDETGVRVDGKLHWVHNASNGRYTYLTISRKRGQDGMEDGGVLPSFEGIAVHDCWAPYWKYRGILHAVCCAHLLRELQGVMDNHPEQTWAKLFTDLLMEMKKVRDKAVSSGKTELSYYYHHKFSRRYDELIKPAKQENPLPESTGKKRGRKKKGKVLALAERLEKHKASVCLFTYDFRVPFDNNQAERDLRMIKAKVKVSGCFRAEDGAEDYVRIMSFVGTAHKLGYNGYEAILKSYTEGPEFILG